MLQVVAEGLEVMKLLGVPHRHQKNFLSIPYLTEGSSSRFLFPRKKSRSRKDADGQKLLFTAGK